MSEKKSIYNLTVVRNGIKETVKVAAPSLDEALAAVPVQPPRRGYLSVPQMTDAAQASPD